MRLSGAPDAPHPKAPTTSTNRSCSGLRFPGILDCLRLRFPSVAYRPQRHTLSLVGWIPRRECGISLGRRRIPYRGYTCPNRAFDSVHRTRTPTVDGDVVSDVPISRFNPYNYLNYTNCWDRCCSCCPQTTESANPSCLCGCV
jgi:hypothetical protein